MLLAASTTWLNCWPQTVMPSRMTVFTTIATRASKNILLDIHAPTATTPSVPPSTTITVPLPNNQRLQQSAAQNTASSAASTSREQSEEGRPHQNQILGRRHRDPSPDSEEQEGIHQSPRDSVDA